MIVCPMPAYDYDFLAENGFSNFIGYIAGILAPSNRKGNYYSLNNNHNNLDNFSSLEIVNFNGTKNIDPVILSSEIKKIKNINQILAKLIVDYITSEGEFQTEKIEGKNLRDRSSILLTPEGFCFNLHDVVKDQVPINMKFYFIISDLYGVKIRAEPRKKKVLKLKLKPFPNKGDLISMKLLENHHQIKYSLSVNKEKFGQTSAKIQFKDSLIFYIIMLDKTRTD